MSCVAFSKSLSIFSILCFSVYFIVSSSFVVFLWFDMFFSFIPRDSNSALSRFISCLCRKTQRPRKIIAIHSQVITTSFFSCRSVNFGKKEAPASKEAGAFVILRLHAQGVPQDYCGSNGKVHAARSGGKRFLRVEGIGLHLPMQEACVFVADAVLSFGKKDIE